MSRGEVPACTRHTAASRARAFGSKPCRETAFQVAVVAGAHRGTGTGRRLLHWQCQKRVGLAHSDQPRTPRQLAHDQHDRFVSSVLSVGLNESSGMSVEQRAHAIVSDAVMQTRARDSLRSGTACTGDSDLGQAAAAACIGCAVRHTRAAQEVEHLLGQPTHRARHANAIRRRKHLRTSPRQDNTVSASTAA